MRKSFAKVLSLALAAGTLFLVSCNDGVTQNESSAQKTDYDTVVAGWEVQNAVNLTASLGYGKAEYENYYAEVSEEMRDIHTATDSKGNKYVLYKYPSAGGVAFDLYKTEGEKFTKLGTGELGFYGGVMIEINMDKSEMVGGVFQSYYEEILVQYRSEMTLVFGEDDVPYVVGELDGKMVAYRVSGGAAELCAGVALPEGIGMDSGCAMNVSADGTKAFALFNNRQKVYTQEGTGYGGGIYTDNPTFTVAAFDAKTEKFICLTKEHATEYIFSTSGVAYDDATDTLYILYKDWNLNKKDAPSAIHRLHLFKVKNIFEAGAEIEYEAKLAEVEDPYDDGKSAGIGFSINNGYSSGIWAKDGKVYVLYEIVGFGGEAGESSDDIVLAVYENGKVSQNGVSFADNFSQYAAPAFDDFFFLGGEVYYIESYNSSSDGPGFGRCKFINVCKLNVQTGETYVVKKVETPETGEPYKIEISQNGENGLCVVYLTENKEDYCYFELG